MKVLQVLVLIYILVGYSFSQNLEKGETLKGTIRDKSGTAISNVEIIAIDSNGLDLTSSTNEDGKYDLYLPAGNYNIEFIAPKGFNNHNIDNYSIKAKSKAKRKLNVVLEINLEHTIISEFQCKLKKDNAGFDCDYVSKLGKTDVFILSGNVSDMNGKIIKGVAIKAIGNNSQNFSTESNKKGFYYIVLPVGKFSVEFRKKGFKKFVYTELEVNQSSAGKLNLNPNLEKRGKAITISD